MTGNRRISPSAAAELKRAEDMANYAAYPDFANYAMPPKERKQSGRIEVDKTEHRLMMEIAVLANKLLPSIEQTQIPVTRHNEYVLLVQRLRDFQMIRSTSTTDTEAVLGLAELARGLSDG